jgi:hypothetical protein
MYKDKRLYKAIRQKYKRQDKCNTNKIMVKQDQQHKY